VSKALRVFKAREVFKDQLAFKDVREPSVIQALKAMLVVQGA
jgi:hypothetical protein